MSKLKTSALLLITLLFLAGSVLAQEPPTISPGETVSGIFENGSTRQEWRFDSSGAELLEIEVQRIGGLLAPSVSLNAPDGGVIAPSAQREDAFSRTLIFERGLPGAGGYIIAVEGNAAGGSSINPNEYSLTLRQIGQRRSDPNPIPAAIYTAKAPPLSFDNPAPPLPDERERLSAALYGDLRVTRPNPGNRPADFWLEGTRYNIFTLFNGNDITRVIQYIRLDDAGITLAATRGTDNPQAPFFFTDQNISFIENDFTTITITLESGQVVKTDFYRLQSVLAIGGNVIATTQNGQLMAFGGARVDLVQDGGANRINLENGQTILTNLSDWDALAFLPPAPFVALLGDDLRFTMDVPRLQLLGDGAGLFDITATLPTFNPIGEEQITLRLNAFEMGDVKLSSDTLTVRALDGRQLEEARLGVADVRVIDGDVTIRRRDGSFRRLFADATAIETPAQLPSGLPTGFNNLGADYLPTCPCLVPSISQQPINPINGNFFYSVTDYHTPSHTLALDLTRSYNSQGAGVAPSYLQYPQFGAGWRHTYQIELDVTFSPLGQVLIVLADGSRHVFRQEADGRYFSATLPMWMIESGRQSWQATRTDGLRYSFDSVGRLRGMVGADGLVLTLAPAPQNYLLAGEVGGMFVVEPYGRRLELYFNPDQTISRARSADGLETRYRYDANGQLSGVDYPDRQQSATYAYTDGRITAVQDHRSPLTPTLSLEYDDDGKVSSYTEGQTRHYRYTYASGTTRQAIRVGEFDRITQWGYDERFRIKRIDTPRQGWFYLFDYSQENPLQLTSYQVPEGFSIRLQFNRQGQITRITDPATLDDGRLDFVYATLPDGHQQRLTEITYGQSQGYERFAYDEQGRVIQHTRLVSRSGRDETQYITRYEYDALSRLTAIYTPAPTGGEVATRYSYDAFGYVSGVSQAEGAQTQTFWHDSAGRLRSLTDGNGNTTILEWNPARDTLSALHAPLGYSVRYGYDVFDNLISMDEAGLQTSYAYDDLNQLISMRDIDGETVFSEYDERGNVRQVVLPDGVSTYRLSYDDGGELASVTTPSGLTTRYRTDAVTDDNGQPTGRWRYRIEDPTGRLSSYVFDALGRIRQVELTDTNGVATYRYTIEATSLGRRFDVQQIGALAGRNISIEYNLLGMPTLTRLNNTSTSYTYNAAGFLQSVTDPSGRMTSYTYDELGNITSVALPGSVGTDTPQAGATHTYTYDANGNLTTATDAEGNTTSYTYDALNRLSSQTDPLGNTTAYRYDQRGNLTSLTDPRGNSQSAVYDPADRLLATTDANGGEVQYGYDALGRLREINQARGRFVRYTYDQNSLVAAVSRPQNSNTLFNYDALGRLASSTDALGRTTTYNYDRLDRVRAVADPVGNITRYFWNSNGRLRRFMNENEKLYEYALDEVGRLSQVIDFNDQNVVPNTLFTYDPAGYVLSMRVGTGTALAAGRQIEHRYTYTPEGWVASYQDPAGATWRYRYSPNGHLVEVVNPESQSTRYTYDANGRVTQIERPAAQELFAYDANGNLTTYTDPNGVLTRYEYDAMNRLTLRLVDAEGANPRRYLYQYDDLGYLRFVEDPAGNRTEYNFDIFGRLTRIARYLVEDGTESAAEQLFRYDLVGNLTGSTQPEGSRISMNYNATDNRVRFVDPEDNVWAYNYATDGKLLDISDPLGSVIRYYYDAADRVSIIEYPNGALVRLRYDGSDQLAAVEGADSEVFDITAGTTRPTLQRLTITYEIDTAGRLRAYQDPDNTRTEFSYDALGNVTQRRNPDGRSIDYSYDENGRLSAVRSPEGRSTRRYDAAGNLIEVRDPSGRYTFAYNAFGEQTSASLPAGITLSYQRDAVGNITQRDAGAFGVAQYTYDSLYQLRRVEQDGAWIEFDYNLNGWRTEIRRSNGVSSRYEYDQNGRPTLIVHEGTAGIIDLFTYQYDSAGNILRVNRGDGWSVLYSYNAAHQIINERWLDPTNQNRYIIEIRYDDAGNRLQTLVTNNFVGSTTLYTYDRENQLDYEIRNYIPPDEEFSRLNLAWVLALPLVAGLWLVWRRRGRVAAFSLLLLISLTASSLPQQRGEYRIKYNYDANGNLVTVTHPAENGAALRFSYDSFNRLTAISGTGEDGREIDTSLGYDAFSHLATWRDAAHESAVRYVYDGDHLIGMQDPNSEAVTQVIHDTAGELLLLKQGEQEAWYLSDALGSIRKIAGADGTPLYGLNASVDYNAFGERIAPYGTDPAFYIPNPSQPAPGFVGAFFEPNAALYLMRLRAYDPYTGRFIQRDPVRHDPQGTLYTYAYNRPGYFVDPFGTTPEPALRATTANFLQDRLIPRPVTMPLVASAPQAPGVAELQAAENFRALQVGAAMQFEVNEISTMLDPTLGGLYVYRINPATPALLDQAQPWTRTMQRPYQNAWGALPAPSPAHHPDPLASLHSAAPLLRQGSARPLAFCDPLPPAVLPLPSAPHTQPYAQSPLIAFSRLLGESPLISGIQPSLNALQASSTQFPGVPPLPSATPPNAPVNPIIIQHVDALHAQQNRFYEETLLIGPLPERKN